MPEASGVGLLTPLALQLAFLGLESLNGILGVVLGFGMLVFVHELGHFLAAKWVGVRVEVFSVGFGPRLFGFARGGTDYRISALPLGGYVKMLGQDDSDAATVRTNEPDDFRNKHPWQRFVILVAGVIMNAIFALIAFIAAFSIGVDFIAPEVGHVVPNRAGFRAKVVAPAGATEATHGHGLKAGDQIVAINGSPVLGFEDVTTMVALSGGHLLIDVARPSSSGSTERLTLEANAEREEDASIPKIYVGPQYVVTGFGEDSPLKGTKVQEGDQLVGIAPVGSAAPAAPQGDFLALVELVQVENPGRPVELTFERRLYDADGRPLPQEPVRYAVEASPRAREIYDIGLTFQDRARVSKVHKGPVRGIVEVGDILVELDGKALRAGNVSEIVRAVGEAHPGPDAKPGEAAHSAPVTLKFERRKEGAAPEIKEASVALERRGPGWFLGIEYTDDVVATVRENSPAAKAGIAPGDVLDSISADKFLGFFWRGKEKAARNSLQKTEQALKDQPFQLTWQKPDGREQKAIVTPEKTGRQFGDLGLAFGPRSIVVRRSAGDACALGAQRTVRMFQQLGSTLRGLFSRSVSTRELGGPIQIASITYTIAQKGMGKLLYFLAILSVNLAVLNILPIPVLDGGHVLLLVIEKLKGRPLSDDVNRYVQYAGLIFVIGLMAYVTFNDIRKTFE